MRLVIISGRSGSGKSTALHVLEDVGFNCIDNLPASLLPDLVKQISAQKHEEEPRVAVSIDARNDLKNLEQFPSLLEQIQHPEVSTEIFYLDAKLPVLITRFSETRRKHPLSNPQVDLQEAITQEQDLLEPILSHADLVVDTSNLSLHDLRDLIKQRVAGEKAPGMAILFQSFGFKYGVPMDADHVFDVRCLPNPYWKAPLRTQTGLDDGVIEFLSAEQDVNDMLKDIEQYLRRWLPSFEANNRSYITVAIGCTGGQHRSVYLSQKLLAAFAGDYANVQVRHRELRGQP